MLRQGFILMNTRSVILTDYLLNYTVKFDIFKVVKRAIATHLRYAGVYMNRKPVPPIIKSPLNLTNAAFPVVCIGAGTVEPQRRTMSGLPVESPS